MKRLTRRQFVRGSLAAGTALLLPRSVFGANDTINVGVIGLGGRGTGHAKIFDKQKGVRVVSLADPDRQRLDRVHKQLQHAKPLVDCRKMMDDKDVDAVVIATCNHWHALPAIWACQTGKDVYVEKPVSWSIIEGQLIVEAARKYKRIVQAGTQQRSDPLQPRIKEFLDSGALGKIRYVRLNRYGVRGSIGKLDKPLKVPDTVDYNLWLGPARDVPIYRRRLQYDWHWVWNTGNGELGNWGPHITDDCRNVVFRDKVKMPLRCVAGGGRLAWNDAGETPNTHFIYYDTGSIPVIFDVHNLPIRKGTRGADVYPKRRTRAFLVIECENGYYAGGRGGGSAYDKDGKKIKSFPGDGGRAHIPNFLAAVRSRNPKELNGEIENGFYSTAWCHLGNISWRLGKRYSKQEALDRVKGCKPWADIIEQFHAHLDANEIDPAKADIKLGAMLEIDPATGQLTGPSATAAAKAFWNGADRGFRKPFTLPEKV